MEVFTLDQRFQAVSAMKHSWALNILTEHIIIHKNFDSLLNDMIFCCFNLKFTLLLACTLHFVL